MKISHIDLGDGEKRPVCFSLSAIEAIEDEFGGLEAMQKGLVAGKVKIINKVLEIMLDAGQKYCAAMGIECPQPLKGRPGDLIDVRDSSVVSAIFDAIRGDSERAVEVKPKN